MQEHPRSAPAHHFTDFLPHLMAVAVDGTGGAERLDVHARARRDTAAGIGEEAAAVGTEVGRIRRICCAMSVMVSAAVDADDRLHDLHFELSFLLCIHRSSLVCERKQPVLAYGRMAAGCFFRGILRSGTSPRLYDRERVTDRDARKSAADEEKLAGLGDGLAALLDKVKSYMSAFMQIHIRIRSDT